MEFNTHYNRKRSKGEINSGEIIVETAGYISAKQRIENLINAGQRLVESRASQYDFDGSKPIDEDFYDPTRLKSYDMADATQDMLAVEAKLASQKRSKASQKDQEGDGKPTESKKAVEPEKAPEEGV